MRDIVLSINRQKIFDKMKTNIGLTNGNFKQRNQKHENYVPNFLNHNMNLQTDIRGVFGKQNSFESIPLIIPKRFFVIVICLKRPDMFRVASIDAPYYFKIWTVTTSLKYLLNWLICSNCQ